MPSVSQRIKRVQQPHGGYLPCKAWTKEAIQDQYVLSDSENLHGSLVGMAVDKYLVRYMLTEDAKTAFQISIKGANLNLMADKADALVKQIKGLDDTSIKCACKLSGFDVCARANPLAYVPIEEINPDKNTINNIRIMVKRTLNLFKHHGPIIKSGFTFKGGYSNIVDRGDADYLTKSALWDLKVARSPIGSKETLQILMYYIMGLRAYKKIFTELKYLGIYNPRLNIVYAYPIDKISEAVINEVSEKVICYSSEDQMKKINQIDFTTQDYTIIDKYEVQYIDVKEAVVLLKVSKTKVYSLIKMGSIDGTKVKNKYQITRQSVEAYIEKKRRQMKISIGISISITIIYLIVTIIYMNKL
ncbi:MAG: helix-turn-helix domain-containing protein [Oscillospiraceae bacterium]